MIPMPVAEVAIIGGGPAGAQAAAGLARAGRKVTLFEDRQGWEKPCGGGLTDKALQRYPAVQSATCGQNWVRACHMTSPEGRRVVLSLDRPIAIYSRRALNGLLLQQACAAGAAVVPQRVVGMEPDAGKWRLRLRDGSEFQAAALVLAAGARSRWPLASPLQAADAMATAGYFIPLEQLPWPPDTMIIRFLPNLEGYFWSFPRSGHASVGICGKLGAESTAALRVRLERELDACGAQWRGCDFYAHVLPAPGAHRLATLNLAGSLPVPWAAVGDTAGLVDPITGEGLYYALRSGEMLAETWAAAPQPQAYAAAVERELLPELRAAARISRRFYQGRFLGASVLERMAQFSARSPRFQALMCDLFSGAQGYTGLRARLYRNLLPSLWELARATA